MTKNFYEAMPSFSEFEKLADPSLYHSAPEDWSVVVTDIAGSTEAIKQGKYREVNLLGAASISTVMGAMQGEDVPFTFGGDGASFLVPPLKLSMVLEKLVQLKVHAQAKWDLRLRLGSVPIARLYQAGERLKVAKYELATGRYMALMQGGGMSFADQLIKSEPETYGVRADSYTGLEQISGLSCRWQPIPSKNGKVLSILILPQDRKQADSLYSKVMAEFLKIFDGDLGASNPVNIDSATYKGLWQCLAEERANHKSVLSPRYLAKTCEILLCYWGFKLGLPTPFGFDKYTKSIPAHSDYRKLDDALRMILDCSRSQIDQIHQTLSSLHEEGLIFYGLHESDNALMTCLVESIEEGGHIHFIDGDDGGYALAAAMMKQQMAESIKKTGG